MSHVDHGASSVTTSSQTAVVVLIVMSFLYIVAFLANSSQDNKLHYGMVRIGNLPNKKICSNFAYIGDNNHTTLTGLSFHFSASIANQTNDHTYY